MELLKQHWKFFIFEGILFIILGIIAITFPLIFTLTAEILIGALFVVAGIGQILKTFAGKNFKITLLSLISGILFICVGALLLLYPIRGILTLTALLTLLFLIDGVLKIVLSIQVRELSRWSLYLLAGFIEIALAYLIWIGWPGTAAWVIGLLVGINMLFFGFSQLFIGLELQKS